MEMELQAYLVQFFFNKMGNKKKKIWEIKRRRNLRTRRSCTLSHFSNANFEKFLMTAKASKLHNCGIHHVTVSIATRILIANIGQIDLSKVCLINLVSFNMQV